MLSKICKICGHEKPVTAFTPQKQGRFGVTARCKSCLALSWRIKRKQDPEGQRLLSKRWKSSRKDAIRRESRQDAAKRRAWIASMKQGPCSDCGNCFPPYVMQFHHKDPATKLFTIGGCSQGNARVIAEIAKCVLLCANCHAIRTYGGL